MKKNICLQICSLREGFFADVATGLNRVAQMGYTQIELAKYNNRGMIESTPIAAFGRIAKDLGLEITGTHIDIPIREYSKANEGQIIDYWKKAIDDHQSLNLKYLIVPVMPTINNREEALQVCDILNKLGEITKNAGFKFGYHNHDYEFSRVTDGGTSSTFGWRNREGKLIFDLLLNNTDSTLVDFQMDVFWVVMGQKDPIQYLHNYKNRIKLLHIRDDIPFGQSGILNLPLIFDEAAKIGIYDLCVELGRPTDGSDPFDGVEACLRYMNAIR